MAIDAGIAGRVAELRAVSAFLAGESDDSGMLVIGEAGVGKTRLVTAAAADVTERVDALVVWGSCLAVSSGLPLLPVLDVLRAVADVHEGRLVKSALADCPPFVTGELTRLMPELEDRPERAGPAEPDDGWRRQRLFEALRRLLAALGQIRPVAVVIDDVQWADSSSLELLAYLLAARRSTGVPIVLTCRNEETLSPQVTEWLDGVRRNPRTRAVRLMALDEDETGVQIELLLGQRVPRDRVASIHARSEGNAFFTEQLVAAESADGQHSGLPTGLRALLLSRTEHVGEVAQNVLAALAVASRPLDEASIAQLCERSELELRQALRELIARQLLRRVDATGLHQLRHALLGEAINGELLAGERRELHVRIAELYARRNEPALAAQIAEHYAEAGASREELHWRVLAARHAESLYAVSEAATQWRRAITLSAAAPVTEAVDDMSLADVYGAAETALATAGDDEAAQALAEEALVRLADADPASRADALRRAGDMRGNASPQDGLELLYRALALYEQLPPPPSAGHLQTLRSIRSILSHAGRQDEAAAVIEQAASLAEHAGHRTARFEILGHQAWHEMAAGRGETALERMGRLRAELTSSDEPSVHVRLAVTHTDILLKIGRLAEVEAVAGPMLRMADDYGMGQSITVTLLRVNMFEALTELGSIESASRLVEHVPQLPIGLNSRLDHHLLACVEMLRGDLAPAQRRQAQLSELPAQSLGNEIEVVPREVELHLWCRQPNLAVERAHGMLLRAAAANGAMLSGALLTYAGRLLILGLRGCADLVEHGRAARDDETVQLGAELAHTLSQLHQSVRPDPFEPGPVSPTAAADHATWLAELSRLGGAFDAMPWAQAAAAWTALRRPHQAAYAHWRHAEALLAAPKSRPAAAKVVRAAAGAASGHAPLLAAIADMARRARIDLSAAPPVVTDSTRSPSRPFGLTDRELAVLRLLGQGRSNPEIAAALFMSTKTASVHVSSILRKLEVATRVQAATVAERAGLLAGDIT